MKIEEYQYYDCKIRMSNKAMADLLYAAIMNKAFITNHHGIGIYDYQRHQNSYNHVDLKIHIHPAMARFFEEMSGAKLNKPNSITIN